MLHIGLQYLHSAIHGKRLLQRHALLKPFESGSMIQYELLGAFGKNDGGFMACELRVSLDLAVQW